jgi:hypothetical protein
MATVDDELAQLRRRIAAMEAAISRLEASQQAAGAAALVVETIEEDEYPETGGTYIAGRPVSVGGDETEGATPTFTALEGAVKFAHLGNTLPAEGSRVLIQRAGARWCGC